jgi:hypothetical protein
MGKKNKRGKRPRQAPAAASSAKRAKKPSENAPATNKAAKKAKAKPNAAVSPSLSAHGMQKRERKQKIVQVVALLDAVLTLRKHVATAFM